MRLRVLLVVTAGACGALAALSSAQTIKLPTTRLVPAPVLTVPGRVDSGVPMVWTRIDGQLTLVGFASWGGSPVRMAGPDLEHLQPAGDQ